QVQEWRQQKLELEAIKNNQNLNINQVRVLDGHGRKAKYPDLEKELVDYIKKKREEKIPVTTHMIEKKAKELKKSLNIEAKCSRGWIKCFRKRHNLVERARTQTAQKFPEDMPLVISRFLQISHKATKNIEKNLSSFLTKHRSDLTCPEVQPTAPCANMRADLMISTYIPKVIRARLEGFFKSKGIIFVDRHRSHVQDDVVKALNREGLDVLEIPSSTTCILQPLDVSIDEGEREFTAKGNRKKASYELICKWVSDPWKGISTSLLAKSFEASGLVLNSDGSEDHKMSNHLQAIVNNRMDEANMDELCEDENELGVENLPDDENDEDDSNNEDNVSNNSNLTNSEDDESAMDIDEAM
ncbi:18847_t:CDS:2, partial [Dentiscutata erythropus]